MGVWANCRVLQKPIFGHPQAEFRFANRHQGEPDHMKRAALYIRVSTVDQNPETQVLDLRQFAVQPGLQIVETYTDQRAGAPARGTRIVTMRGTTG